MNPNDPAFYCVMLNGEARELQKVLAFAGQRSQEDLQAIISLSSNAVANAQTILNWANEKMGELNVQK